MQPEPAAIASTVGPPLGVDGVHARRRVAYSELSNSEAAYRNALVVVRAVEAEANPLVLSSPAVIGLAVSAPGTTWTPLPELASSLKKSFLAAFSYVDPTKNRLPARFKHENKKRKKNDVVETPPGG